MVTIGNSLVKCYKHFLPPLLYGFLLLFLLTPYLASNPTDNRFTLHANLHSMHLSSFLLCVCIFSCVNGWKSCQCVVSLRMSHGPSARAGNLAMRQASGSIAAVHPQVSPTSSSITSSMTRTP